MIQGETLAREGEKFYNILTATGGVSPAYTPGELWAGRQRQGGRRTPTGWII